MKSIQLVDKIKNMEDLIIKDASRIKSFQELDQLPYFGFVNGNNYSLYIVNTSLLEINNEPRIIVYDAVMYVLHYEKRLHYEKMRFADLTKPFVNYARADFKPIEIETIERCHEFKDLPLFLRKYNVEFQEDDLKKIVEDAKLS